MYTITQVEERERLYDEARHGVRALLTLLGRDPDHPSVVDTPDRWVRAYMEMGAVDTDVETILHRRFELSSVDSVVAVGPIPFVSICEHHLLPFTGRAWVAYKPEGSEVVGLSKLARLVLHVARRPQIQERMTEDITAAINDNLQSAGAACVIRGEHSCMSLRGVRVQGAEMVTSSLTGLFRHSPDARAEFLALAHA